MIVCGLDPSLTSTGIAILRDGQPVALNTVGHGTRNGSSYAHRSDRIVSQCRAVVDALPTAAIDLAVIEGPAYAHANASTHDSAGLWWGLFSALRAKRIPTAVVAPMTAKKWASGQGRAEKQEILTSARSWFPDHAIRNDDIADALVLALLGAFKLGEPMPFKIKRRHYTAIEAINWPEQVNA